MGHNMQPLEFNSGLSDEEKNDLQTMIADYQQSRQGGNDTAEMISKQMQALQNRMVYLTTMFSAMEQRIDPLLESIRLLVEKNETLNQRIDTIIESLRSGESL
jgi:uncharacterized protein YaaN involved in tellurite resistance